MQDLYHQQKDVKCSGIGAVFEGFEFPVSRGFVGFCNVSYGLPRPSGIP